MRNSEISDNLIRQEFKIQENCNKQLEVDMWDQIHFRLVKVKVQITFTQDNFIYYSFDGKVLRMQEIILFIKSEQHPENQKHHDQFNNIDQIKYLHWVGEFGQNNRKSGKWKANWSGPDCKIVGGYYENGLKQGLWNEFTKNYWSQAEICENGEYFNDQKIGEWKYIYDNTIIGGGQYNKQGQKQGKWIELSDGFFNSSQVTYYGEYQNGKKVGIWDIFFREKRQKIFQQIGGGSYDIGIKNGMWIELSDRFQIYSQVTYQGRYKQGRKIDRWDIHFNYEGKRKIGGGLYEEIQGDSIKIGNWVELNEQFSSTHQVTHSGEYQNGKKVGRWDIFFRDKRLNRSLKIGGGLYDTGVKIGIWIEQRDGYHYYSRLTFHGRYQNGKKVGRWYLWALQQYEQTFELLIRKKKYFHGGFYDEVNGGSNKIGKWIEYSDGFNVYSQITYEGEYKNGKKVGKWDTWYYKQGRQPQELIGGGMYSYQGLRNGKWAELSDGFEDNSQVILYGEYKNGHKIGRWDIFFRENKRETKQLIAGGFYNEQGQRNGEWRELKDGFENNQQIILNGEYKNGNKIGRWDIFFKVEERETYELIGGGLYYEVQGGSIKAGQWIELDDDFEFNQLYTQKGEYKNGNKVGTWVKMDIRKKQL
ncbi:unnamed protein product [Paramecium pentaurelia]|uniref:Uncharacterized protein n=1 Tax=Paramecium pentaurelia TaxID=43138 RepID=A0A8S1X0P1_9CILI|nr:unnamed protein product [Paramecium pentaurelia]